MVILERICTWKSGWCWIQVRHLNLCAFEPHSFIWLMLGWPKSLFGVFTSYRDIWTVFLANLSTSEAHTHSCTHTIFLHLYPELKVGSQALCRYWIRVVLSDRVLILWQGLLILPGVGAGALLCKTGMIMLISKPRHPLFEQGINQTVCILLCLLTLLLTYVML